VLVSPIGKYLSMMSSPGSLGKYDRFLTSRFNDDISYRICASNKLIRFEFAGDYFSRKQLASVWSPSYSDREQMETDITDIQHINR
jgi:hypothetical protein